MVKSLLYIGPRRTDEVNVVYLSLTFSVGQFNIFLRVGD